MSRLMGMIFCLKTSVHSSKMKLLKFCFYILHETMLDVILTHYYFQKWEWLFSAHFGEYSDFTRALKRPLAESVVIMDK
jgi:hypothetical protein